MSPPFLEGVRTPRLTSEVCIAVLERDVRVEGKVH